MSKLRIGVIFGGIGEERTVSVRSAEQVAKNLNLAKYDPYYVGITPSGEWRLCDGPGPDWESTGRPATVSADRTAHGLVVDSPDSSQVIPLDVVVPVLHGRFGEDGSIQGLLELAGIPYVGCDLQSSVLALDKSLTYLVIRSVGIATPRFWTIGRSGDVDADQFAYPVFVKPARSGSSFGVARVERKEDLPAAVEAARQFDTKVLVEEAVAGTEVGCAVLEGDGELITSEVDQIRLSHGFFHIHQETAPEFGSENATVIVPADISAADRDLVQQTAKVIFRALGCRGLARVDLFLTDDGEVLLNEVNTLPGLTTYSRYPRMMEATGISRAETLDRLITLALSGDGR